MKIDTIYFYGGLMSRWKQKKQSWQTKKAARGNCSKRRRAKNVIVNTSRVYARESPKSFDILTFKKDVPRVFSIVENTEETLDFFHDIIAEIRKRHYKEKFFFNFESVSKITIDAIMYLLAIMKNIYNGDNTLKQSFSGNYPKNMEAYEVLTESGFYNYVETANTVNTESVSQKIQISDGDRVDVRLAKEICDFVNTSCGTVKQFTHDLYEILIEVMTNTVQHAYSDDEIWKKHNWYVFIENMTECVQFTFLDIGEGIPKTINKKVYEKFLTSIRLSRDSDYIVSALNGEFRSQTKLESRGNGLPTVKSYGEKAEVEEMHIISGRGICIFEPSTKAITKKGIQKGLDGTLFYWKIKKDNIKKEFIK